MHDRLPPLLLALLCILVPVLVSNALREQRAPAIIPDKVVVVYPPDAEGRQFVDGVRLAVEQVNAAGGAAGRPLRVELVEEVIYSERVGLEGLVRDVLAGAERTVNDASVLAIVGHGSSATAVPASAVYNRSRKLYFATHATATSLTHHGFRYVFAMQPNNDDAAKVLANYANRRGWRRVVALSDSTNFAVEVTDRFRSYFTLEGGTILYRTRQIGRASTLESALLFLLDNKMFRPGDIDAFFVAASSADDYVRFLTRARALGLNMPVMGGDNLYSRDIELEVGPGAMRDVVAFSVYDEGSNLNEAKEFHYAFVERFAQNPGPMAAVGFDAVKLLAFAANAVGAPDPVAIADKLRVLRYEAGFSGATGPLVFDAGGLLTDTDTFIMVHDGTGFRMDSVYSKPLDWLDNARMGDDAMPRSLLRENVQ
jgi:branched-chain amino acid transport system substrate-binding protein